MTKAKTNKVKLEDKILAVCTWIGKARRVIRRFKRKHTLTYYLIGWYIFCMLVLLIGLPVCKQLIEVGVIVIH